MREQREQIALWWLDRMVAVERPWTEKRTLLWHNHWATSVQKVKSGAAMLAQNLGLDYRLADTEPPSNEKVAGAIAIFRAAGLNAC